MFSCQEKKNRSGLGEKILIELPSKVSNLKDISDSGNKYISSIEYIQLQSAENAVLGKIDKLIITDNRVYILDIFKYGGVFVYDREGQVINTINLTGQGPDEYSNVFGIYYEEQDSTINLLCRHPNKLMKLDMDGRKVIKQFSLQVALLDLKKLKDGTYVGYTGTSSNNSTHSIFIFSEKFELIRTEFFNKSDWTEYTTENKLSTYDGKVYFTPEYGYTEYEVMTDTVRPYYTCDFGIYSIPMDVFDNKEKYNKLERNRYISCIKTFQETNNYLIFSYLFQGSNLISFFSKSNKTKETFLALNNPISKLGFGNFISMDENHIVTYFEAETAFRILNNQEIRERIPEGVEILDRAMKQPVNETDEPILCIYNIN